MLRIVYRLDEPALLERLRESRRLYVERTSHGLLLPLLFALQMGAFAFFGYHLSAAGFSIHFVWGFAFLVAGSCLGVYIRDRLWVRRELQARTATGEHEILIAESALGLRSPNASAEVQWPSITRVFERRGNLVIVIDEGTLVLVPAGALAAHGGCAAVLADFGAYVPAAITTTPARPGPNAFWLRLMTNLQTGVRSVCFLPVDRGEVRFDLAQAAALAACTLAAKFTTDVIAARFAGHGSYYWGVLGQLGYCAMLVAAAGIIATIAAPRRGATRLIVLALAMAPFVAVAENLARLVLTSPQDYFDGFPSVRYQLGLVAGAWLLSALAVQAIRWHGVAARRVAAIAAAIVLGLVVRAGSPYLFDIWMPDYGDRGGEESAGAEAEMKRWRAASREAVLYGEARLLDDALAGLAPQKPGDIDLYWLAVAGWGSQDVFKNETALFATRLAETDATKGRGLELVNNPASVGTTPLASVTSIGRALQRIGQLMDPAEDVLFLFATSHGSAKSGFSLMMNPYDLDDLAPAVLKRLLDESGIRWRVIVISSCYAGTFVPVLADDNTLIVTAAAADRKSFGCANDADLTYFGRALLADSMRPGMSFLDAFEAARKSVSARELAEKRPASNPQLHAGAAIIEHLARREHQRVSLR